MEGVEWIKEMEYLDPVEIESWKDQIRQTKQRPFGREEVRNYEKLLVKTIKVINTL